MESKWNARNRKNNTKKYKVDLFHTRDIPFMSKKFENDIGARKSYDRVHLINSSYRVNN